MSPRAVSNLIFVVTLLCVLAVAATYFGVESSECSKAGGRYEVVRQRCMLDIPGGLELVVR